MRSAYSISLTAPPWCSVSRRWGWWTWRRHTTHEAMNGEIGLFSPPNDIPHPVGYENSLVLHLVWQLGYYSHICGSVSLSLSPLVITSLWRH
jgi:hypothetical protein